MARDIAERWAPCPEGELDRLQSYLRATRFRQTLSTIILAVATTVAVAGASYSVANAVRSGPPLASTGGMPPKACNP